MRNSILYILGVLSVFLLLQKTIDYNMILGINTSDLSFAELLNKSLKNTIIIILAIFFYLKTRKNLKESYSVLKISNIPVTLILLLISFVLFFLVSSKFEFVSTDLIILFLISCLSTGFAEEIVFRGIIQSKLVSEYDKIKGVVLCSCIFGLLHFLNLFKDSDNIYGITNQVFFTISIGTIFGGLVIKTKNLLAVGVFHGIINFTLSFDMIMPEEFLINNIVENKSQILSLVITYFFFLILFSIGILLIKSEVDKNQMPTSRSPRIP